MTRSRNPAGRLGATFASGLGALLALVAVLVACGPAPSATSVETALPSAPPTGRTGTPMANATPGPTPFDDPQQTPPGLRGLTCPNDTWPPMGLPGEFPGVSVQAIDRYHMTITNATSRTLHFEVLTWEVVKLEACVGLDSTAWVDGPLAPGRDWENLTQQAADPNLPLTVAIWDAKPDALIYVTRSPIVPAPS
jgi:hypothetical protein